MSKVKLRREGGVYILTMQYGENRFNPSSLGEINAALDEVERSEQAVLVTTGEEKFYTLGVDLEWMTGEGIDEIPEYIKELDKLYARLITFPMATAAAINGHTFGAGSLFALSHDYRVMRNDQGYFCFPEVDIRIPFSPVMREVLMSRLQGPAFRDVVLTGTRLKGEEAKKLGIVDHVVPESEVLDRAIACVSPLVDKDRTMTGDLKCMWYRRVLDALAED